MFIQEQGYQLARSMGNRDQQVSFLINMASTARTAGKLDQAAGYGTEALELVQPATALQGLLFNTLADITYRRGDFASACGCLALTCYSVSCKDSNFGSVRQSKV